MCNSLQVVNSYRNQILPIRVKAHLLAEYRRGCTKDKVENRNSLRAARVEKWDLYRLSQ